MLYWRYLPKLRHTETVNACTVDSIRNSFDDITSILVDISRDWLQTMNGTVFNPIGTVDHMLKKSNNQSSVNWILEELSIN